MPKGTSWAEATLNSEKINPCQSKVSQSFSQQEIPLNKIFLKFHGDF